MKQLLNSAFGFSRIMLISVIHLGRTLSSICIMLLIILSLIFVKGYPLGYNDQGTTIGWVGLGCLGWAGMGWVGMGWDGMGWVGMRWVGMRWDGLGWVGLGWVGLGWVGMGWDGMGWVGERLGKTKRGVWFEFEVLKFKLKWTQNDKGS